MLKADTSLSEEELIQHIKNSLKKYKAFKAAQNLRKKLKNNATLK